MDKHSLLELYMNHWSRFVMATQYSAVILCHVYLSCRRSAVDNSVSENLNGLSTVSSQDCTFPGMNSPSLDCSFSEAFVPWTICSLCIVVFYRYLEWYLEWQIWPDYEKETDLKVKYITRYKTPALRLKPYCRTNESVWLQHLWDLLQIFRT